MENRERAESAKRLNERKRVAEDIRVKILEPMDCRFQKLIYLTSLRDNNTARYHHPGLEALYGSGTAEEGLRECHIKVFEDLIALPLRDQTRDLIQFFDSLREARARMI